MRILTAITATVALAVGCGGSQTTDSGSSGPTPENSGPAGPSCCAENWEEPPAGIGETPPDRPAPQEALDPLRPPES